MEPDWSVRGFDAYSPGGIVAHHLAAGFRMGNIALSATLPPYSGLVIGVVHRWIAQVSASGAVGPISDVALQGYWWLRATVLASSRGSDSTSYRPRAFDTACLPTIART